MAGSRVRHFLLGKWAIPVMGLCMRNRLIPVMTEADKSFVRSLLIHEDAAVLVFNKPSGLPVQSRGNKARCLDELLWAFARSNGKRPRLVHRIDAGTSGLVIAAKTQPVAAFLSAAFEARQVEKCYLALCSGALPRRDKGVIDASISKLERPGKTTRSVISKPNSKTAQSAQTHWSVLSRSGDHALIEARPTTGRMHQIRVHLADIGLPILGDTLYGGGTQTAPRLMLHAAGLSLPHPGGETLQLEAPIPADFAAQVKTCGL